MLNKISEELKEARLKNGVTLEQLALKTRIDQKFLEALDNGNFSFLPELYVKAFLREYAKYVGLDDAVMVKKYDAARLGKVYEEQPPAEVKPEPEEVIKKQEPKPAVKYTRPLQTYDAVPPQAPQEDKSDPFMKKRILLGAVIGGTIIVIALVYFLFFNNGSEIIVPEKQYDEVIEDNQRYVDKVKKDSVKEGVKDSIISTTPASFSDSLRLNIKTTDTCWVKILLDDKRTQEFRLFPNGQKTITTADNYKIIFGRSSAVKLMLNDKPLTYSPGGGNVSYALINRSGVTNLKEPPVFKQGAQ